MDLLAGTVRDVLNRLDAETDGSVSVWNSDARSVTLDKDRSYYVERVKTGQDFSVVVVESDEG